MSMGYIVLPCHYLPFAKIVDNIVMESLVESWNAQNSRYEAARKRGGDVAGERARLSAVEALQTQYSVTVAPTPLKDGPEQTERISYAQWIQGLY
jgi:hypothetical protein